LGKIIQLLCWMGFPKDEKNMRTFDFEGLLPDGLEEQNGRFISMRDNKEMIFVAPGRFLMGGRYIQISKGYFIDKYPILNSEYAQFAKSKGYPIDHIKGAPDSPAAGITWYEAEAYANWAGKQLPPEALWMKAESRQYLDGIEFFDGFWEWAADWIGKKQVGWKKIILRRVPRLFDPLRGWFPPRTRSEILGFRCILIQS
jgi:formylglycine-generating enzyme required for sulfatase activity